MNWNLLRIKVKQKGMTSVKEAQKVSYYEVGRKSNENDFF